jgi:hypothetical protein
MLVKRYRVESFEWAKIPNDIPRENLVLMVSKTSDTTIHPNDPNYPIRMFNPIELYEAARSLAKRPIGLNHIRSPDGTPLLLEFTSDEARIVGSKYAFTVDSNYNKETQAVESLLCLPKEWVSKIRRGEVTEGSVEYTWRDEIDKDGGKEFIGLIFDKVDLLEGLHGGDSNTSFKLVEAKIGLFEGELAVSRCKDCPHSNEECKECKESIKPESISSPAIDPKAKFGNVIETPVHQEEITKFNDNPSLDYFKEAHESADMFISKRLGEPFAGYKDFADCVSKNRDKGNPDAYCGYIKHKVESFEDHREKDKQVPEYPASKVSDVLAGTQPKPLSAVSNEPKILDKSPEIITSTGQLDKDVMFEKKDLPKSSDEVNKGQITEKPMNTFSDPITPTTDMLSAEIRDKPDGMISSTGQIADREVMDHKDPHSYTTESQSSRSVDLPLPSIDKDSLPFGGLDKNSKNKEPIQRYVSMDTSKQRVESQDVNKQEPVKEPPKEVVNKPENKNANEAMSSIIDKPEPIVPPQPTPTETPKPIDTSTVTIATETQKLVESQATKIKELQEATDKLQKNLLEKDKDKVKAISAAKKELLDKIEKTLPSSKIVSQFNRGGQMLATDIRKVIYEEKEKEKKKEK